MPPKFGIKRSRLSTTTFCPYHQRQLERSFLRHRRYTSTAAATATTPAGPIDQTVHSAHPIQCYPPTQPPAFKPPEFRKSQLLRQYASLLQSCPLVLLFQHNNLKSNEWMAIRRELASALRKLDEMEGTSYADEIKIHIVQTGIIAAALNLISFYSPRSTPGPAQPPPKNPKKPKAEETEIHPTDPRTNASAPVPTTAPNEHILSTRAHRIAQKYAKKRDHGLEPLLSGPLMLLTFPTVSPQHLSSVLSLLSPSPEFPAPRRRANPGYYDHPVQSGLQKLLLLGARVEGRAMDGEGVRWVGGIVGGIDGLRGELVRLISGDALKVRLVRMLEGVGGGLVSNLEAARMGVWRTLEGRRMELEKGEKGEA